MSLIHEGNALFLGRSARSAADVRAPAADGFPAGVEYLTHTHPPASRRAKIAGTRRRGCGVHGHGRALIVARAAAGVLLVLVAVVIAMALLDVRYLVFLTCAAGLAVLGRTVRWRTLGSLALGLALLGLVVLISYLASPFPQLVQPPPRVSIRYVGQIDASGMTATLTETVVCDQQFEDNVADLFAAGGAGGKPALASLKMPEGWRMTGSLDGSPVYVRTTSLPESAAAVLA